MYTVGRSSLTGERSFSKKDVHTEQPKFKRNRVALACQRCRSRKQKCNGAQDTCSTCASLGLPCQYKAPLTTRPDQKKEYISALESRVAQLESMLSTLSQDTVGDDHWNGEDIQQQDVYQSKEGFLNEAASVDLNHTSSFKTSPSSTQDDQSFTLPSTRVYNTLVKIQSTSRSVSEKTKNSMKPVPRSELVNALGKLFVKPSAAPKLLDGWIKHLSTQYPVIHSLRLKELHSRRDDALSLFEESILHLVYANSGRILEAIGETGDFYPVQHFEAALENIDAVLELRDTRSVAYLLLIALYCFRGPRDSGAWAIAGLAVRTCIELDLHRKSMSGVIDLERELQVRIFWSCYYLDRGISVALGRPPAISDDDIDVEFPIDIDEEEYDSEALRQAAMNNSDPTASPPTTLTPFIHFMRLRRIESKIEHITYRADPHSETTSVVIQGFLDELNAWKDAIPMAYYKQPHGTLDPAIGIDNFTIPYYKVIRLLIYPQLSKTTLNFSYLQICADACAGLCGAYKRLHRMGRTDCSPFAVQALFLTGLTLLHCTWLAPRSDLGVEGAISECNLMLYVMAERCPPAQKYRDVFEKIHQNVSNVMARRDHSEHRSEGILDTEVTEKCRALDKGLPDIVRTPYSQIISDLASDGGRGVATTGAGVTDTIPAGRLPGQHSPTPQSTMSPGPKMDYGLLGHAHGSLVDSTSLYDWEELTALNADWGLPDAWMIT